MFETPSTAPGLKAALAGGIAAAALDFIAAMVNSGNGWLRIGQAIASGIQGAAAFKGGAVSAALGVAAHTFILLVVAGIYVLAARRMEWLWRNPVIAGLILGVIVYAVMNAIVLPFSAVKMGDPPDYKRAIQIGIHMAFVGLPIALAAWKVR